MFNALATTIAGGRIHGDAHSQPDTDGLLRAVVDAGKTAAPLGQTVPVIHQQWAKILCNGNCVVSSGTAGEIPGKITAERHEPVGQKFLATKSHFFLTADLAVISPCTWHWVQVNRSG
jgi:hypothetical protein